MPLYLYKHPTKDEYIEVIQKMNEEHIFIDDEGTKWERVWTKPNASMGMNADPDSPSQFVEKTKRYSVGEMWDYSAELKDKRISKRGHDQIGEAHENKRKSKMNKRREKRSKKS